MAGSSSDSGNSSSSSSEEDRRKEKKRSRDKDKEKHRSSKRDKSSRGRDKEHKHKKDKDKKDKRKKRKDKEKHKSKSADVVRSVISGKRIKRQREESEADIAARQEREMRLRILNEDEDTMMAGGAGGKDKPPTTMQEFAAARMKAARSDPKLMAQIMEEAKAARRAKREKVRAARLGRALWGCRRGACPGSNAPDRVEPARCAADISCAPHRAGVTRARARGPRDSGVLASAAEWMTIRVAMTRPVDGTRPAEASLATCSNDMLLATANRHGATGHS